MNPDQYMTNYYGAVLTEEYDTGHGEPYCCDDYMQLVELSNGYVVGNSWDTLWDITGFRDTRKEIDNHDCGG